MLVLIPKGNSDTQSIGLLEVVWKVAEVVIYTCIRITVKFNDALHGFRAGRGTGTAIIELKLAYELASLYQTPLFLVLLGLRKAYKTLDRGRLL